MRIRQSLFVVSLTFVATLLACSVSAQTTETVAEAGTQTAFSTNVFGVGLNASLCSGMGLSFRHHIANVPLAYQLSGGIWKSGDIMLGDIGAEVQFDLAVSSNRLYVVAGFGYYSKRNTAYNPADNSGSGTNFATGSGELDSPTRFGAGIGYEVQLTKNAGVSGNLMITFFEPSGDILPLPSIGLFIYFK